MGGWVTPTTSPSVQLLESGDFGWVTTYQVQVSDTKKDLKVQGQVWGKQKNPSHACGLNVKLQHVATSDAVRLQMPRGCRCCIWSAFPCRTSQGQTIFIAGLGAGARRRAGHGSCCVAAEPELSFPHPHPEAASLRRGTEQIHSSLGRRGVMQRMEVIKAKRHEIVSCVARACFLLAVAFFLQGANSRSIAHGSRCVASG